MTSEFPSLDVPFDALSSEDGPKSCRIGGKEFASVEFQGKTLLVPPRCPHRGTPMTEARVEGNYLICRRHGATFDLRTGGWVRGPQCANIALKVLTPGEDI